MAQRATKSGFAAEAFSKVQAKYDPELAAQCMCWIGDVVPDSGCSANGDMDYVADKLGDGFVLCKLINSIGGKTPANGLKPQKLAFKKMESINMFLEAATQYGVPTTELFQTVDLYEKQNLNQVVICLQSLARKMFRVRLMNGVLLAGEPACHSDANGIKPAQAKGYKGFGPKEADKNERHFTDEQLKAGQGVIGLQMGSNKGATQAGQSFGKSRMIVD